MSDETVYVVCEGVEDVLGSNYHRVVGVYDNRESAKIASERVGSMDISTHTVDSIYKTFRSEQEGTSQNPEESHGDWCERVPENVR